MPTNGTTSHYREPGWFTKHVFNNIVAVATRLGVSVWGSRVLEVRGRKTGQARQTPVNLLTFGDATYLVAARGETEWVRNVRAADGQIGPPARPAPDALRGDRARRRGEGPGLPRVPRTVEGRGRRLLRRGRPEVDR